MIDSTRRIVAVYCRISKKDDRSTSMEKQRANVRRVAAERFPGAEVVEFADDGVSSSKGKARAGLNGLLAFLGAPPHDAEVVAVIVDTLDRLTRDRGNRALWETAEACEKRGAVLVGASQEIDLGSAGGEMTVGVLAAAARFEARRTAERVKATNDRRREAGLRALGGPPVWGFVRDGDRFLPDPERAPVVLDAVRRIIAGETSIRALAEEFSSRAETDPLYRTGRGGTRWSHKGTANLLRSPALAGMTSSRGDVVRGEDGLPVVDHDAALLDLATYRALHDALDARAVPTQRVSCGLPLLHGIVEDECGHTMYRHAIRGRRTRYTCRLVGCPVKTSVDLEALDAHVSGEVLDVVGDLAETTTEVVREGLDTSRLASLRAEIARTSAALGSASASEIPALAERLGRLRATEAAEGAKGGAGLLKITETGRSIRGAFDAADDTDARRGIVAGQVSRVLVLPGQRGGQHRDLSRRVRLEWHDRGDDAP